MTSFFVEYNIHFIFTSYSPHIHLIFTHILMGKNIAEYEWILGEYSGRAIKAVSSSGDILNIFTEYVNIWIYSEYCMNMTWIWREYSIFNIQPGKEVCPLREEVLIHEEVWAELQQVVRWRDGEVARWRGGEVARWRGGEVARWRGGEVRALAALEPRERDSNPRPICHRNANKTN